MMEKWPKTQIHSLSVIASICGSDERRLYRGLFFFDLSYVTCHVGVVLILDRSETYLLLKTFLQIGIDKAFVKAPT